MLTLSQICGYLPYELKFFVTDQGVTKIATLSGIYVNASCVFHDLVESEQGFESVIPILIPLSEFGDSDDTRKVHEFIGLGKWCDHYDEYFDIWFDDLSNIGKLISQAPQEIFNYFLANHYDVYSLIPSGDAMSIHEINKGV